LYFNCILLLDSSILQTKYSPFIKNTLAQQRPLNRHPKPSITIQLIDRCLARLKNIEEHIVISVNIVDVLAAENQDLHRVETDALGLFGENVGGWLVLDQREQTPTVLVDVVLFYFLRGI
jgi:cystathionine beta-lyase family protein involved in aluminum resistance